MKSTISLEPAALADFRAGFSCSQAVLAALAPQLGVERVAALRLAGAFGGGMARLGLTCGAVTGALMALGLRYGKVRAEDEPAKEETYDTARAFVTEFQDRHGALACRELLGCDIGTPEGRQTIKEQGLSAAVCEKLVADAVEIASGLI